MNKTHIWNQILFRKHKVSIPLPDTVLFLHIRQRQNDPPGLGDVLEQQSGYPPMSEGVPVDSILRAVLQREAKVEVQVQHVPLVRVGQSGAVEIGFNHIIAQERSLVLNLGREREGKEGFHEKSETRGWESRVGDGVPQAAGIHLESSLLKAWWGSISQEFAGAESPLAHWRTSPDCPCSHQSSCNCIYTHKHLHQSRTNVVIIITDIYLHFNNEIENHTAILIHIYPNLR